MKEVAEPVRKSTYCSTSKCRGTATAKKIHLCLGIERDYKAKELEALFYFVDWVVAFSDSKARNNFVGAIRTMAAKEEIHMPYVTSIEEVTREETRLAIASKMLKAGEPNEKVLMYAEISPEELAELKKRLRLDC